MYLYDRLHKYSKEGYYPFHMPGHKRNIELMGEFNPYIIDVTEIEHLDNMHDAQGVIKTSMERAAQLYGSDHTYYLVNGSTSGNMIGICASTKKGDKILMARNCHKSVYQAVMLNELNPVYLYPQYNMKTGIQCGYSFQNIKEMLIKHPDVKLIVLVSPTYEGVLSDITQITQLTHKYGIPILVDEAHGAHLGLFDKYPQNSIQCGADIVIHSVHKTLPSFTQSSLLHINGNLVDYDKIKYYYSVFQSSSPSYILMAGIDRCIGLLEKRGSELFESLEGMLVDFYSKMQELLNLKVLPIKKGRDYTKLIISTRGTNMTGHQLYETLLNQYQIQMEMEAKDYVLGISSIGDVQEGFTRLAEALIEIDQRIYVSHADIKEKEWQYESVKKEKAVGLYDTFYEKKKKVLLAESTGMIAADFVNLYPPGIPILVPGEIISKKVICKLKYYMETGLTIQGLFGNKYIHVINGKK